MVVGVGIDTVQISRVERFMGMRDGAFQRRTFTENERKAAEEHPNLAAQSYAGLYAVKEAVFKAIGHRTKKKVWDFRCVETAFHEDGAPYIVVGDQLRQYMDEAGVAEIYISITNEGEYATAIAVAESARK